MKYIVFAFLLVFPFLSAKADIDPALQGEKAENFIKTWGADAIGVLEKSAGDEVVIRSEFKTILNQNFDMNTLARFAMGRYWAIATPAEQKEYNKLFANMVVDVYSKRFADYSGQKFEVVGHKPAGRKDFIVNSLIAGEGAPIKVDWRVRNGKVIDVVVAGVSMSVTQRSEFASVIQRNGGQVASLITHLQK